ncbi:hypothetical protein HK104_007388 [Borealophlyctis nickersoniae]|nr:hypothetical protein HK104_007388 [Borealophlyctis nickersoniae]
MGPFLRGFSLLFADVCTLTESDYKPFFEQRGTNLEIIAIDAPDITDRTLNWLIEFCTNLLEVPVEGVTETGIIDYLRASPNLEQMVLPDPFPANDSVKAAAATNNVCISEAELTWPTYSESKVDEWVGW